MAAGRSYTASRHRNRIQTDVQEKLRLDRGYSVPCRLVTAAAISRFKCRPVRPIRPAIRSVVIPDPEGVDSKVVAEPFEMLIEVQDADSRILRRDGDGEIGEGIAMGAMGAVGG